MASPNDQGAAAQQVVSAVPAAYAAPREVEQRFEPDAINRTSHFTATILEMPIRHAEALARIGPASALNGAGQIFCTQFAAISNKFPLDTNATQEASLDEFVNIFGPGKALDEFRGRLKSHLIAQGSQYISPPGGSVHPNPEFIRWINNLIVFADTAFPGGSAQPHLSFTLTQLPKNRFQDLSISVGPDKLSGAGLSKQFTWTAAPGAKITLSERGVSFAEFEGPWAPFRFGSDALWQHTEGLPELQFAVQTNGRQQKFEDGTPKIAYYELKMNNSWVLNKARLASLRNCVRPVALTR